MYPFLKLWQALTFDYKKNFPCMGQISITYHPHGLFMLHTAYQTTYIYYKGCARKENAIEYDSHVIQYDK